MSLTKVQVQPLHAGGMEVTLTVPCSEGPVDFVLLAERDRDGDWRVSIPWPDPDAEPDMPDLTSLPGGYEVANGILYLASDEQLRPLLCTGCGESLGAIDQPDDGGAAHPECATGEQR